MLKHTLLYIAILFTLPLKSQMSFQNDTIQIKEVVISGKKIISEPAPGYKKIAIDSSVLQTCNKGTIADLLSRSSNIYIKSYGMGGAATPSFRGTGAGHTQITWNGININNPMLGQSDLSLLPVGLLDDIQIYFGGASMVLNSGGIGGIIDLETKPLWNKGTAITLSPGIGSFGQYTGLAKVRSGSINFQTVTKAFLQSSENNFPYLNSEISVDPILEIRKNSQIRQQGFIQELYFRKNKNLASARIWYQSASRNLPAPMLTQQLNSGEKQFDESLRIMLDFNGYKERTEYYITGAWMINKLNYLNRLVSIDSRNVSDILVLKGGLERSIGEYTKMKVVINEELSIVNSNNYNKNSSRNTTTLTTSAERKGHGKFGAMVLIRGIFDKNSLLIPDFSAGLQFRIFDEKEYFLKANISRNSKIPSLNDMFWIPGGNPGLKNEYAYIYEVRYEMNQKISFPLSLSYDLSLFRNNIKDMIQWHPGEYSYWTADNIQSVNSMGLESSVVIDYRISDFISRFTMGYTFTNATNVGLNDNNMILRGKQLIYMPVNQANASLALSYKHFYSSWIANMTGIRFTTVDNSRYLPGYFLNSISTGFKVSIKGNSLDMNFNIDNLFNINYQSVALYPLPGRAYFFKILVQIVK